MLDHVIDSDYPWQAQPAYLHHDHEPSGEDRTGTGD